MIRTIAAIAASIVVPLGTQVAVLAYRARESEYALPLWVVLASLLAGYLCLIQAPRLRSWLIAPLYLIGMFLLSIEGLARFLALVYEVR
jgi:hypothetical protein